MIKPTKFLVRMGAFLLAAVILCVLLIEGIANAFNANPPLNGLIVGVFAFGVALVIRQVVVLGPEVDWMSAWVHGRRPASHHLRLLGPLASILGDSEGRPHLTAVTQRALLDTIAARLDEQRELARYFVGLLIFLGLLGTFWGLTKTVGSIGSIIASLTVSAADPSQAFEELKRGLGLPLSGMGTAFSTSLFGLSGSLVLGFLDLQAGRAQNTFFCQLEDILASHTQLDLVKSADTTEAPSAYAHALTERLVDSLEELTRALSRSQSGLRELQTTAQTVREFSGAATEHFKAVQKGLVRLDERQASFEEMTKSFVSMNPSEEADYRKSVLDALKAIEATQSRMLDESARTRSEVFEAIRTEGKLLARTLAASCEALARR